MSTIEDYGSGRILQSIRRAHVALRLIGIPFAGTLISRNLEQRMESFAILPVTHDRAREIIMGCRCCAVGPRVCSSLFPGTPASESVFLDDLAEAMARAGKARMVMEEEACSILGRYPKNPVLLSKVSGRYLEICHSEPSVCIYWQMRRCGLVV